MSLKESHQSEAEFLPDILDQGLINPIPALACDFCVVDLPRGEAAQHCCDDLRLALILNEVDAPEAPPTAFGLRPKSKLSVLPIAVRWFHPLAALLEDGTMMGVQTAPARLSYDFCFDDHVPHDHLFRRVDQFLDLEGDSRSERPSTAPLIVHRVMERSETTILSLH